MSYDTSKPYPLPVDYLETHRITNLIMAHGRAKQTEAPMPKKGMWAEVKRFLKKVWEQ